MGQYIETYEFADGSVLTSTDIVNSLTAVNTITGTSGNDTLTGTDGNDILLGLDGTDSLFGGDGDDILDAGANSGSQSSQYLYGQGGNDTYLYSKEDAKIFIHSVYEGANDGTADKIVFDDLNFADITVTIISYGGTIGDALNLAWDDGTDSGQVRIGQMGQYIESYEFADGQTYTYDDFIT